MIKLLDLLEQQGETSLSFPEGFEAAKKVPNGGAMCANCAKWDAEEKVCKGQYYIKWNNGNGEIPTSPNEYVCVWWVQK